jgi:hypothetical protein
LPLPLQIWAIYLKWSNWTNLNFSPDREIVEKIFLCFASQILSWRHNGGKKEKTNLLKLHKSHFPHFHICTYVCLAFPKSLMLFSTFFFPLFKYFWKHFFSQMHTMTIHIKLWQQHCNVSRPKNLTP